MSETGGAIGSEQTPVLGYCRNCGKAIHEGTGRPWQGTLHCMECLVELSQTSADPRAGTILPPSASTGAGPPNSSVAQPLADGPSPALALLLGIVPGVGAVYNGQYAKGVVHAVIFGGLISLMASDGSAGLEPLFGALMGLMIFYMPIEAYRTARALQQGLPVDELSGFMAARPGRGRSTAPGILLIVAGVVFLLHSLGYWRISELLRYWPAILIAAGIYLLYLRISERAAEEEAVVPLRDSLRSFDSPVPRDSNTE